MLKLKRRWKGFVEDTDLYLSRSAVMAAESVTDDTTLLYVLNGSTFLVAGSLEALHKMLGGDEYAHGFGECPGCGREVSLFKDPRGDTIRCMYCLFKPCG